MKKFLRQARGSLASACRQLPGYSSRFGPPRRDLQSTPDWYASLPAHESRDCSLIHLRSGYSVQREMPAHADPPIARIFEQMGSGRIKDQFVAVLRRGRYWGRCFGYIINNQDYLHRDLSPSFDDVASVHVYPQRHDALTQIKLPPVVDVGGAVAAVNTLFSPNFHHWLLDCVPRFGLLKEAGWNLNAIDAFILPSPLARWHQEVLALLDIPSSKVISSHTRLHLRADRLVVPSFSEASRQPELFNYTPQGLAFVRNLFLLKPVTDFPYPERIIVSREKAQSRRLLPADRIHKQLEALGFTKIFLEDYSLAEQAHFFNSAKTIIMPTGGGLANIAFCQPGAQVVELFDPSYLPTFSHVICQELGLEYYALVGENHTEAVGHSDAGGQNDIRFQEKKLVDYVHSILK
jgi:capsular polysaccharide biosynthesis protein